MQKELIELRPQLIQTRKETDELIEVIEKESVDVQQVKEVVEVDEAAANKAAQESHAIKVNIFYSNASISKYFNMKKRWKGS